MKSYRKELWFQTPTRRAFISITGDASRPALRESGIREGLVLVAAMHITASVFINDDEPGLRQKWLEVGPDRRPVPAQRGRGQRRRAHEAPGHGRRSSWP